MLLQQAVGVGQTSNGFEESWLTNLMREYVFRSQRPVVLSSSESDAELPPSGVYGSKVN